MERGVRILETAPGEALARAGLRPGDLLLEGSWAEKGGATVRLDHPADLLRLEVEGGACHDIEIEARRNGEEMVVSVPAGRWAVVSTPQLSNDMERTLETVLAIPDDQERLDRALALAEQLTPDGATGAASWLLAEAWTAAEVMQPVDGPLGIRALDLVSRASADVHSWALEVVGLEFFHRGELQQAASLLSRSRTLRLAQPGSSLLATRSSSILAVVVEAQGDLDQAEQLHQNALDLRKAECSESLAVASSLSNLGIIALNRGDLSEAQQRTEQALKLRQKLAPEGLEVAESSSNLGQISYERGDLVAAEAHYRTAWESLSVQAPGDPRLAVILTNLGAVAFDRGDFVAAEDAYRRALQIDRDASPESLDVALSLYNLGELLTRVGRHEEAESVLREALDLQSKSAPDTLDVAFGLDALGRELLVQSRLREAEEAVRRGLGIREQKSPESLDVAESLLHLGEIHLARERPAAAKDAATRATELASGHAPESAVEAKAHALVAVAERALGHPEPALAAFRRAIEAVEAQQRRAGTSPDHRGLFRAQYLPIYREYVATLVDAGRPVEAFEILERSRAQQLLAMFAERELLFGLEIPPELDRERRLANLRYDRIQRDLADLSPVSDRDRVLELRRELREVRRLQDEISARIRRLAPGLAEFQRPRPRTVAEIARALDPGTVIVAYSVGAGNRSFAFTLQAEGSPAVTTIPAGTAELRQRVERFRRLVHQPTGEGPPANSGRGLEKPTNLGDARPVSDLIVEGAALYELLVEPVARRLDSAERVLLLPDGPLHLLPFAALSVTPSGPYFVETIALHHAPSVSIYLEQIGRRASGAGARVELLAFGDPEFGDPAQRDEGAELRSVTGRRLARLPSTRTEIEALAALYGPEAAETYVGDQATESRAKATMPGAGRIHFATHGLLDDVSPVDSALALAPEADSPENGLLQVWEIIQQVRLDADLVVLSACDTALGGELDGEGLIGLTRAFQFAGARSTVASLWPVADEQTAGLMESFHRHLLAGRPKDEALRTAQAELAGATSEEPGLHPFYWAAFRLSGDWR